MLMDLLLILMMYLLEFIIGITVREHRIGLIRLVVMVFIICVLVVFVIRKGLNIVVLLMSIFILGNFLVI